MKYFVRNTKGNDGLDYVSVYARVRHYTEDKKLAIGLKVLTSEWQNYCAREFKDSDWMTSLKISFRQFDIILNEIKVLLEKSYNPETAAKEIKKIREKNIFTPTTSNVIKCKDRYFSAFFIKYVEDVKKGKYLKQGKATPVSPGYIRNLNNFYNKFIRYEEENGRVPLDSMDMAFRDKYIIWCNEQNYSINVIANDFGYMCRGLRLAFYDNLTKNDIFLNPSFIPKRLVTDAVYLTMEQIDEMLNFDVKSNDAIAKFKEVYFRDKSLDSLKFMRFDEMIDYMERTRDMFIAGCLTGQRESDYFRYNKDMICSVNGTKFLKVKQIKTKKTVMIPLDRRVEIILKRYKGKMPDICTKTFNAYLHILCEILGWTWVPQLDNLPRNNMETSRFCDLVGSHTARRSFATNAYMAGVPISSIIAITGHAREEGLRRYLKINSTEKAIIAGKDMQGFMQ